MQTANIKCLLCGTRHQEHTMKNWTCVECQEDLLVNGDEYMDGETMKSYVSRLKNYMPDNRALLKRGGN